MNTKWIGRIFLVALMILIFIAAGGQAVLHLWNWLLPPLFGWKELSFWQAVGILALCRILFGHFGGRPMWRSDFRRRMGERWETMTPEQREKFRQGMRGCGSFGDAKDPA
jgi:Ca2+/H+ antiporter, TMEM165/GDT1 family